MSIYWYDVNNHLFKSIIPLSGGWPASNDSTILIYNLSSFTFVQTLDIPNALIFIRFAYFTDMAFSHVGHLV